MSINQTCSLEQLPTDVLAKICNNRGTFLCVTLTSKELYGRKYAVLARCKSLCRLLLQDLLATNDSSRRTVELARFPDVVYTHLRLDLDFSSQSCAHKASSNSLHRLFQMLQIDSEDSEENFTELLSASEAIVKKFPNSSLHIHGSIRQHHIEAFLAQVSEVKTLHFSHCLWEPEALYMSLTSSLPKLSKLVVYGAGILFYARNMSQFPNLKELGLMKYGFSARDFYMPQICDALRQGPFPSSLERVHLQNAAVKDDILQKLLAECLNLSFLDIRGCKLLSQAAIQKIPSRIKIHY